MQLVTIRRRADFLRVRGGMRWSTPSFSLEARERDDPAKPASASALVTPEGARFGFTVTKKIGNAVVRNRIKRRLREAVRHSARPYVCAEYDYVLFARVAALRRRFADLQSDVVVALQRVHAKGKRRPVVKNGSEADRKPRTPAAD